MRFIAVLPLLLASPGTTPVSLVAPAAATEATPRVNLVQAIEVLHAWDRLRLRAWTQSDVAALRKLYTTGSDAGHSDVRLLRAYRARGVVVRRLVTQIFAVEVLRHDPRQLRLRVFDRVAGAEVVHGGHARTLPATVPVTRTIEFRRQSGRWVVAGITDSAHRRPEPREARR